MKTETEVYNEVIAYINAKSHKRPCTLASIKKVLRSQAVVDLIFSRPDIFHLEEEIKHVPAEKLTENNIIKLVLANPKFFSLLEEDLQTVPVMVAFEFSKRRYEYISFLNWGTSKEQIPYTGKIQKYQKAIMELCDLLEVKYNNNQILEDYLYYIDQVSKIIETDCHTKNPELKPEKKYKRKYRRIDLGQTEKVVLLVSGVADAGKTTFSNILADSIKNSICFDSDMLLERNLLTLSWESLVPEQKQVIVFSDLFAYCFFNEKELSKKKVINIIMKPSSIETRYRYSKYMQGIPFEQYQKREGREYNYDAVDSPILVTNDYTDNIYKEVDNTIEEIAHRLNVPLPGSKQKKKIKQKQKR